MSEDEKTLRRMLCLARANHPYMDDGEAQDNEGPLIIDYLRDSVWDIQRKHNYNVCARHMRDLNANVQHHPV